MAEKCNHISGGVAGALCTKCAAVTQQRIADLERASRTRSDYDLRCRCGAPHWLDTSLPSEVWNQIAPPEDLLCLLCINERLEAKGLTCNEAELYFAGTALKSKLYAESHGTVAERDRRIAELEGALRAMGKVHAVDAKWHEFGCGPRTGRCSATCKQAHATLFPKSNA